MTAVGGGFVGVDQWGIGSQSTTLPPEAEFFLVNSRFSSFNRAKVKQGKEAVDAALQSEWCTCPRGEKGKRRRRTACARDVAGWLWLRFRVKFCLKTVTADLREIKINSM